MRLCDKVLDSISGDYVSVETAMAAVETAKRDPYKFFGSL